MEIKKWFRKNGTQRDKRKVGGKENEHIVMKTVEMNFMELVPSSH